MPISEDSSIIPRKITHSEDAGIIPANLPAGGGGSFAFRQSIFTDGVDDSCATGTSSSVWNPFINTNDVSFSCWARSSGAHYNNFDSIYQVEDGTTFSTLNFGVHADGTAELYGKTRNISFQTTFGISTATQAAWTMYSIVITQNRSNQVVKIYVNAVLEQTFTIAAVTLSSTSSKLSLSSGSQTLAGYLCEAVFSEYAFTDADVSALYNAGAGAKPTAVLTSVHSYYPVTEAAGQTTGTIADLALNADLTMSNFAAPNGTSNERP